MHAVRMYGETPQPSMVGLNSFYRIFVPLGHVGLICGTSIVKLEE